MAGKEVHFSSRMELEASSQSPQAVTDSLDERMNDSSVFTLLFQQCVVPGETAVEIDKLMDFIQKLRLGEQKEGEEVFDSESSSSSAMSYDLATLRTMFECNCDENKRVEEDQFLHTITAWVAHVRQSTGKNVTQSPSHEVTSMAEESPVSDFTEDRDLSYGSYHDSRNSEDTSRRSSARHEAEETIARLQFEIKCLNDRNRSLMRQYDGSEEALKDYQQRNQILQSKLDEAVGNLNKLKELEFVNSDLSKMLSETKSMNEDLIRAKERLNREVEKMRTDYDHLDGQLSDTKLERDRCKDQLKSTQSVLSQMKEEERVVRTELELKLNESKSQMVMMANDLEEAGSTNAELKAAIMDLEGQLHHIKSDKIFTSTPFRGGSNRAVSLLEEFKGQETIEEEERDSESSPKQEEGHGEDGHGEDGRGSESPDSGSPDEGEAEVQRLRYVESHESPEVESFKKRVNEKDVKIQSKTSAIMQGISDIMSPDVSTNSFTSTSLFSSTDDHHIFKEKLQGTLKEKVKLKKENKNLRRENSDLLVRLHQLEALLEDMQGNQGFDPAHPIHQVIEEDEEAPVPPAVSTRAPLSVSQQDASTTGTQRDHTSTGQQYVNEGQTSSQFQQTARDSPVYTSHVPGNFTPIVSNAQPDHAALPIPPPQSVLPQGSDGFVPTHIAREEAGDEHIRLVESSAGESLSYGSQEDFTPQTIQATSTDTSTVYTSITQDQRDVTAPQSLQNSPITSVHTAHYSPASGGVTQPVLSVAISYTTNVQSGTSTAPTPFTSGPVRSMPQSSPSRVYTVSPQGNTDVTYTTHHINDDDLNSSSLTTGSDTSISTTQPPPQISQVDTSVAGNVQYTVPGYGYVVPFRVPATTTALPQPSLSITETQSTAAPSSMSVPSTSIQSETLFEDRQMQPPPGTVAMPPASDGQSSSTSSSFTNQQDFPMVSRVLTSTASSNTNTTWDTGSHTDQENVSRITQEGPVTKVTPRFLVSSKDPTVQADGIVQENSDLSFDQYSQTMGSIPPYKAAVRTQQPDAEANTVSKTGLFLSQSTPPRKSHRRTKSTGSSITDGFAHDSISPAGDTIQVAETTLPSGVKLRRYQVLPSEPDALQKSVVGVVNIRPQALGRDETGMVHETEMVDGGGVMDGAGSGIDGDDVVSMSHVVEANYDDYVDLGTPIEVRAKPETVDSATSTTMESMAWEPESIPQSSRCTAGGWSNMKQAQLLSSDRKHNILTGPKSMSEYPAQMLGQDEQIMLVDEHQDRTISQTVPQDNICIPPTSITPLTTMQGHSQTETHSWSPTSKITSVVLQDGRTACTSICPQANNILSSEATRASHTPSVVYSPGVQNIYGHTTCSNNMVKDASISHSSILHHTLISKKCEVMPSDDSRPHKTQTQSMNVVYQSALQSSQQSHTSAALQHSVTPISLISGLESATYKSPLQDKVVRVESANKTFSSSDLSSNPSSNYVYGTFQELSYMSSSTTGWSSDDAGPSRALTKQPMDHGNYSSIPCDKGQKHHDQDESVVILQPPSTSSSDLSSEPQPQAISLQQDQAPTQDNKTQATMPHECQCPGIKKTPQVQENQTQTSVAERDSHSSKSQTSPTSKSTTTHDGPKLTQIAENSSSTWSSDSSSSDVRTQQEGIDVRITSHPSSATTCVKISSLTSSVENSKPVSQTHPISSQTCHIQAELDSTLLQPHISEVCDTSSSDSSTSSSDSSTPSKVPQQHVSVDHGSSSHPSQRSSGPHVLLSSVTTSSDSTANKPQTSIPPQEDVQQQGASHIPCPRHGTVPQDVHISEVTDTSSSKKSTSSDTKGHTTSGDHHSSSHPSQQSDGPHAILSSGTSSSRTTSQSTKTSISPASTHRSDNEVPAIQGEVTLPHTPCPMHGFSQHVNTQVTSETSTIPALTQGNVNQQPEISHDAIVSSPTPCSVHGSIPHKNVPLTSESSSSDKTASSDSQEQETSGDLHLTSCSSQKSDPNKFRSSDGPYVQLSSVSSSSEDVSHQQTSSTHPAVILESQTQDQTAVLSKSQGTSFHSEEAFARDRNHTPGVLTSTPHDKHRSKKLTNVAITISAPGPLFDQAEESLTRKVAEISIINPPSKEQTSRTCSNIHSGLTGYGNRDLYRDTENTQVVVDGQMASNTITSITADNKIYSDHHKSDGKDFVEGLLCLSRETSCTFPSASEDADKMGLGRSDLVGGSFIINPETFGSSSSSSSDHTGEGIECKECSRIVKLDTTLDVSGQKSIFNDSLETTLIQNSILSVKKKTQHHSARDSWDNGCQAQKNLSRIPNLQSSNHDKEASKLAEAGEPTTQGKSISVNREQNKESDSLSITTVTPLSDATDSANSSKDPIKGSFIKSTIEPNLNSTSMSESSQSSTLSSSITVPVTNSKFNNTSKHSHNASTMKMTAPRLVTNSNQQQSFVGGIAQENFDECSFSNSSTSSVAAAEVRRRGKEDTQRHIPNTSLVSAPSCCISPGGSDDSSTSSSQTDVACKPSQTGVQVKQSDRIGGVNDDADRTESTDVVDSESTYPTTTTQATMSTEETNSDRDERGRLPTPIDDPLYVTYSESAVFQEIMQSSSPSLSSILFNSIVVLLIMVLLLALLLLMVLSQDALERCGSYCPHSPVHLLYATFEPYFQYSKVNTPT